MTELADVQDLGSCAAGREGSSPFFRIQKKVHAQMRMDFYNSVRYRADCTFFFHCFRFFAESFPGYVILHAEEMPRNAFFPMDGGVLHWN